jgi:hypothetical protein
VDGTKFLQAQEDDCSRAQDVFRSEQSFFDFLDTVCELLSGQTSGQVLNEEFERAIAPFREQLEQQRLRIDELQVEVVELRHLRSAPTDGKYASRRIPSLRKILNNSSFKCHFKIKHSSI